MSAERLRAAAALLRERAEAATPGPWSQVEHPLFGPQAALDVHAGRLSISHLTDGTYRGAQNAALIAVMNPTVALALADWLEADATLLRPGESIEDDQTLRHAGRVADAILAGGAS